MMPDFDYKLWIDPLSLHDYKDNTLTLSFPYYDDEILRYLENNYKDCLEETLGSLLSEKIEICFIISRIVSSEIKLISSELNPKFSFDNLIYSKIIALLIRLVGIMQAVLYRIRILLL